MILSCYLANIMDIESLHCFIYRSISDSKNYSESNCMVVRWDYLISYSENRYKYMEINCESYLSNYPISVAHTHKLEDVPLELLH